MIRKTEMFTEEETGNIIIGEMPLGNGRPIFHAKASLNQRHGDKVMQFPFEFEIDAATIEEAFLKFPDAIESATLKAKDDLEKLKKQSRDQAMQRKILDWAALTTVPARR